MAGSRKSMMRHPKSSAANPRLLPAQRGFSLIVSLMMLIVIVILGISASQMAVNEERGSRNNRDRQIAFQAAEAALKDAEYEIMGSGAPACTVPLQHGNGRSGSSICFNQGSGIFFVANCGGNTPAYGQGLCAFSSTSPAYLSSNVNFYGDATGVGGNGNTVLYGQFTGKTYPSQQTSGLSGLPISKYPPRYIIEVVPRNITVDGCSSAGSSSGSATGCQAMFRVTAMGFGANPNAQVVLQTTVSTQD